MIRSLIYLLVYLFFMPVFIKQITEYLQTNWGDIFANSVISGLLLLFGISIAVSQWLWQQNEKNLKSEISATKALLTLKEEQYLKLEKELKSKDTQIEELTKNELKIKTLESDLATLEEKLTMSELADRFQREEKIKQDKEINSYIDRIDRLLNINEYYELSAFELQKQVLETITEIKIYYEKASEQLESIMPSDYYGNKINLLRSSENYKFDSLLEKIKQDFSDKYKNDILLLTEVLISRTGGNNKKLTSLGVLGMNINNHKKNKPLFDNIESTIFQLESLTKKLKGFSL